MSGISVKQTDEYIDVQIEETIFNVDLARQFKKCVIDNLIKGIKKVKLDLSEVQLLDSIAVGMLVHAQTICTQEEVDFSIVNVNKEIMKLIAQVKLDKILNITPGFDNFDNN